MSDQVKNCPLKACLMVSPMEAKASICCEQSECAWWITPHDNETLFYGCSLKVVAMFFRACLMPLPKKGG